MNSLKELPVSVFKKYQELIYKEVGISLAEHKRTLVQSRLRKWILKYNLNTYDELYEKIASDKSRQMITMLVNAITTNVTSFFREENQWIYLQNNLENILDRKTKKIRIWSAACSSGQEPYTIVIFLKENLKDFGSWDLKILATDISEEILQKAIDGKYPSKDVEGMPKYIINKYFTKLHDEYIIKDEIKNYVTFRVFNLVTGNFNIFKNKFNMIFCRNVMIYFDRLTQNKLLSQYIKLLNPNSRLFIGHSESIHDKDIGYKMIQPSIYKVN